MRAQTLFWLGCTNGSVKQKSQIVGNFPVIVGHWCTLAFHCAHRWQTVAELADRTELWNSTLTTPTEIRLSKDKRQLTVSFDNGDSLVMYAELLRVESPSAEVQGHDPSQKKIIPAKRHVKIMKIEPVGNYAVRITFDDLHDTGIYSWETLHRLGRESDALMQTYLQKLEEQGLSR